MNFPRQKKVFLLCGAKVEERLSHGGLELMFVFFLCGNWAKLTYFVIWWVSTPHLQKDINVQFI